MKRFREKDKLFLAEVGKNFKGEFLTVTEFMSLSRSPRESKERGGTLLVEL